MQHRSAISEAAHLVSRKGAATQSQQSPTARYRRRPQPRRGTSTARTSATRTPSRAPLWRRSFPRRRHRLHQNATLMQHRLRLSKAISKRNTASVFWRGRNRWMQIGTLIRRTIRPLLTMQKRAIDFHLQAARVSGDTWQWRSSLSSSTTC